MKIETTIHIERDEGEIELQVLGHFSPGHPGKLTGLPENCFPPEPPEGEVEKVLGPDGKPFVFLSSEEEARIMEQAVEAVCEAGDNQEDDGPDYDDRDEDDFDDNRECEPLDD